MVGAEKTTAFRAKLQALEQATVMPSDGSLKKLVSELTPELQHALNLGYSAKQLAEWFSESLTPIHPATLSRYMRDLGVTRLKKVRKRQKVKAKESSRNDQSEKPVEQQPRGGTGEVVKRVTIKTASEKPAPLGNGTTLANAASSGSFSVRADTNDI